MKILNIILLTLFVNFGLICQTQPEAVKFEAEKMIKAGKFGEAIELLDRYISAKPQNPEGYNLRGTCYEKRAQFNKAVYDYRSALKLAPENNLYKQNLDRVTTEWEKLIYNKIEGYKREIAINPLEPQNYLEIGKSYKNLGKWKEAEKWYDEYLSREEASSDEILRYTEILAKNNHISKGWPILKRYTEKDPGDHRLWSRFGYFSMWLGKKQTAISAFENALKLRPYFKEALDGYDLARGKGYIYTVNDTTVRFNYGLPLPHRKKVYAIDKYYRIIKRNPANISARYKLINELMKHNRYEEAVQQLNFIRSSEGTTHKFKLTETEVLAKRKNYYSNKINTLKNDLNINPFNRKKVLELGRYYSYSGFYNNAIDLYDNYLQSYPGDDEIRYQKALLLSWNKQLSQSKSEVEKLLANDPANKKYKLLYGQDLVWMNKDLDAAERNLKSVLSSDPNNLQALPALTSLNLQKNNLTSAKLFLNKGYSISPKNVDLARLEKAIEHQEKINEENKLYSKISKAREFAFNKNCDAAIEAYLNYFADPRADMHLKNELAEAYLCKKDYSSAIKIYDDLIKKYPNDYQFAKQRAKIYYWMGDSLNAVNQFERLVAENPADAEAKLFLGDSYMKMREYKNARSVYEELLAISPTSHILNERMKWLGSEGIEGYSSSVFPVYFSIVPVGYYFNDNLDFTYSKQGLRAELGITNYLSVSGGGYFGFISDEKSRLNLNIYRADAYLKFSKTVSGYVAGGVVDFRPDKSSHIFEMGIKAQKEKKYTFSATLFSTDAALILYSPYLVDRRLTSNYLLLTGEYITKNAILVRGDYSYTSVSDDNNGNRFIFRLGKIFEEVFAAGYEYYYYNFKEQTPFYWSPENYESHSIWFDWEAIQEESFSLKLKGKVGLIPRDNFILREISGYMKFYFTRNLFMQANSTFGSSVRDNKGYSSFSFGLSFFWSI